MENKHKILFSRGRLYLNDVQIAGTGITPDKGCAFEFATKEEIVHKKLKRLLKKKILLF